MESKKAIFAERLKEMIEVRGISQAQLAKEMQTTPQAISSYVKGKTTPNYDMLCNIANQLDVSIDFLLGNVRTISAEELQLLIKVPKEKVKEVTLAEIEKKFNSKVKIVKEKNNE